MAAVCAALAPGGTDMPANEPTLGAPARTCRLASDHWRLAGPTCRRTTAARVRSKRPFLLTSRNWLRSIETWPRTIRQCELSSPPKELNFPTYEATSRQRHRQLRHCEVTSVQWELPELHCAGPGKAFDRTSPITRPTRRLSVSRGNFLPFVRTLYSWPV